MAFSSRRNTLVALLVLAILVVAIWYWVSSNDKTADNQSIAANLGQSLKAKGRSVILITLDTTRPDRLQPYGSTEVATPNLQNLANRGVVFENAWAVAPITLVSHASILSGLYPFEHGVRNNGTQYVAQSIDTLAESMKQQGYQTSAFVSAAVLDHRYGLNQGFDTYDDDLSDRNNVSPRMVADRRASSTVDATMEWLDKLDENDSFFSWVHFYDPHANYSPPPPFRDDYRESLYDGEIAYMDEQIGRLLEHPKLLGAGDKAPIVLVIADHGESLGEHGERTHALLAYDSTLHIPFILYVPGGPSGVRVKESVGHVDVMPTLLSLLDIDLSNHTLSGRDLSELIMGRQSDFNRPYYSETYLPYYTYGWEKLKVIRKGRWKMIDAPESELYDLVRDPRELTDVYSKHSDTSYDMKRDLDEWLAQHEDDSEASLALDSDELAKLRSLGYLSVGSGNVAERTDRPNPMAMIGQHVGLERARMLLADRFYQQAVNQLQNVLRRDPQNLAALIDLVRAHEGLGQIDQAIEHALHALELDPEYIQTYLTLARLESQNGDVDRAIELTDLAIDLDPKNPDTKITKASFLTKQEKVEQANQVLENAMQVSPDHPRLNSVYAHLVEARAGKLDAAEARLRLALEKDPYLEQSWRFLGQLLERGKRFDEAEQSYRSGLKSRPDDSQLHGALGHLLARLGRKEEAEIQLREAIRLTSTPRSELYVSLGGILAEQGRLEEARKEYEKVNAIDPGHPGARNNAAIAMYRTGQIEAAKAQLKSVIEDFPNHADAHNNLSAIAVDEGDWESALKYSKRTLELSPGLVEARNNLAIAQEELGHLESAKSNYLALLEADPEYWPGYYNLGLLLLKSGDNTGAIENFNQALLRMPNHPDSHLELGLLYAKTSKDNAMALNHLNAFLRHGSGHPRREEIKKKIAEL